MSFRQSKPLHHQDDLHGMAYISRITSAGLLEASTLNDIAEISIRNNKLNNITGILCYGNGYFFQFIEGSEQSLTNLKNELLCDNRHQNMNIVFFEKIESRSFPNWAMQSLVLEGWMLKNARKTGLPPFRPDKWLGNDWQVFLAALKKQYNSSEDSEKQPLKYNTLGVALTRIVGEHQAFFVVQALLAIIMILTIVTMVATSVD